ncbi:PPE family protein [Mycobacterium kansasii]|uniref:PPE family protein n=1 Tax=Mycobacterium kansasii TaxID=1768 RepID=A0A1V3XH70_MYCKA|nr:PPE family protein [Mycobacterium kansasii]
MGAAASAVAQAALDTQHELLAAALLEKASHVAAAAGAHQSAVASMVTAQEAVANRRDEAVAQEINPLVWGALTPQIVALSLEYYGQMWPRNAAAGAAYGAALRAVAAAIMVPFPPAVAGDHRLPRWWGGRNRGDQRGRGNPAGRRARRPRAHPPATAGAGMGGWAGGAVGRLGLSVGVSEWCLGGHARRAPTLARAPQPPMGMFAQVAHAGGVAAPSPAIPGSGSAQLSEAMQSRAGTLSPPAGSGPGTGGVVSGYPGAGFTSYIRPTGDGFSPPAAQRPGSGAPAGMLTTATLYGPVTAAPSSTGQPLAYVHPQPPRPSGASSPAPRSTLARPPTLSTPHPHHNLRHPHHRPPNRLHRRAAHPVPAPVATALAAPGAPAPRCWVLDPAKHPRRHQCCHRWRRNHRFRRHRLRRRAHHRWGSPHSALGQPTATAIAASDTGGLQPVDQRHRPPQWKSAQSFRLERGSGL